MQKQKEGEKVHVIRKKIQKLVLSFYEGVAEEFLTTQIPDPSRHLFALPLQLQGEHFPEMVR